MAGFMADREHAVVKTPTQAREGVTGHNARYVLLASLTVIILVFAGVWLYYFG